MHVILWNMRITKCRLSAKAGGEIYFLFFRIAQTILQSKLVVLVSTVSVTGRFNACYILLAVWCGLIAQSFNRSTKVVIKHFEQWI